MRAAAGIAWWGGLFLLLLLAPLPIGAVNTEWSMPLALLCFVLGGTGLFLGRRAGARLPVILLPLVAFLVVLSLQLVPLPEGLLGRLSPESPWIPALPDAEGICTLSVYPGVSLERTVLHLGLFYLLWALMRMPARGPLRMLTAVGLVHAALAFVLSALGATGSDGEITRVLWVYEWDEVLTPAGTYLNKNHFAGLMVVSGGACLAILCRRWTAARDRLGDVGARAIASLVTGKGSFRLLVPGVTFLVIVLALFASGSRGAAVALLLALLIMLVVALTISARRGVHLGFGPLAASLALIGLAACAAVAVAEGSVLDRLVPGGRYLNRPRLWKDTVRMAMLYPVAGTGIGTFPYIYPRYQSFEPDRDFGHAESDWVQYLAETGIAGAAALALFGFLVLRRLVRLLLSGGRDGSLALGGSVGILAVVLHGFLDVSLRMPANLLAAIVLLGALLGLRVSDSGPRQPISPGNGGM